MFFKKEFLCQVWGGAGKKIGIRHAERKERKGHGATCPEASSVCAPLEGRD